MRRVGASQKRRYTGGAIVQMKIEAVSAHKIVLVELALKVGNNPHR